MAGIAVSAIANKVDHCDSLRTSPSGTGGKGESQGAMRLSSVLVIAEGLVFLQDCGVYRIAKAR